MLCGCETWTMRKVDSDRIQSFHMQALRRIVHIRWYKKVSNTVVNERTKLPMILIDDRRHSLFGHTCRLLENTPASQALQLSIEAHTGTSPLLTGSARRVVHEELGCNKWKKPVCWCCPDRKPNVLWRLLSRLLKVVHTFLTRDEQISSLTAIFFLST